MEITEHHKLKEIHGLFFPFRKIRGQYGKECSRVIERLKELSTTNQYAAVVMVGQTMGMIFKKEWTQLEMCQQVIDSFVNLFLSDLEVATSYILYQHVRLPSPPRPKTDVDLFWTEQILPRYEAFEEFGVYITRWYFENIMTDYGKPECSSWMNFKALAETAHRSFAAKIMELLSLLQEKQPEEDCGEWKKRKFREITEFKKIAEEMGKDPWKSRQFLSHLEKFDDHLRVKFSGEFFHDHYPYFGKMAKMFYSNCKDYVLGCCPDWDVYSCSEEDFINTEANFKLLLFVYDFFYKEGTKE